ncbi:PREDICTED: poly(A)-specific ribonuclease PARN-like domain-containing protein 1 [Papilio polytes]|uniref:poly(A)-specific ribonuclease PARN-like domain-containing protein 1 n=1 Tax=Papilio polytes TaxID=76194 RepID=UPI000676981E|nr:PREDICTED: poly(A)-specific ribonuclease PARN-like domain-containing protein 1 [Papilio polytes]
MEITRKNFAEELENITNNLKRSCFIGFDAEFTALLSGECFQHRLFDTNEERYNKIKDEVSNMIISQVGLTMFQYDRDEDGYNAIGYTFHLCPQVLGDIDQSFIFQASTLKFLCKHNFNFNKFIYEGIPYLSKVEEDEILEQIKNNNLASYLTSALQIEEEKEIQYYGNKVSEWLHTSEEGTIYIDVHNPIQRYLIHIELRQRFPHVLTTDSLGNSNKILVYRDKSIEGANNATQEMLEKNLLEKLLGFSNIIKLLVQYKKPIIGHNLFMDLILLHNQFIGPLPKKYSIFKKNINNMFPEVFDTKYISHEMGKKLTLDEVWQSNILQESDNHLSILDDCTLVLNVLITFQSLDENDPPTHRPDLLHIKSLKERIMNIDKVASAVAGCGAADVRALGRRAALVAAGTHFTAERILKKLNDSRDYRVSTYKPYAQSAARRLAIWSGALITGSLLLVLLHKRVKS